MDAQSPPGGPSDAGSMGGSEGGPGGPCSLAVTVTTVTDNGNYSPENVGAIWIANGSGTFVKTLEVWAKARISHLNLWNSATTAAGLSRNTVDAITGASLSSYRTHMDSWNCTDTTRAVVPDGAYRVYFETADSNSGGPNGYVDFTKSSSQLNLSPPNQSYFTGIKLVFTP
jgi:hypothetical protein